MKQYIVLLSMIALGVFIYDVIVGGDGSILAVLSGLWAKELAVRTYRP
ncbi:MAG: hypothetical protein ACTTH0_03335 [Eubacteriales bacterium]